MNYEFLLGGGEEIFGVGVLLCLSDSGACFLCVHKVLLAVKFRKCKENMSSNPIHSLFDGFRGLQRDVVILTDQ